MASRVAAVFTSLLALTSAAPWRPSVDDGSAMGVFIDNPDAFDVVPNSYIVMYNNTFADDEIDAHEMSISAAIKKRNLGKRSLDGRDLSTAVKTFRLHGWRAMALDGDDLMMNTINSENVVSYVEANTYVKVSDFVMQSNAPPGLERLSHGTPGQPGYVFDNKGGEGITAYIVDTGIRTTHEDFQGRATIGFSVDGSTDDANGHGSHVAGTVGGATFGVAKNVNLIGVKVLDSSGGGTNAGVLEGLQWVADDAESTGKSGKSVLNMSLGGPRSRAVHNAIEEVVAAGVVPVVAAGNDGQDAQNVSPASSPNCITVGAIDASTDQMADFSNFGSAVDIFAPGVDVESVDASADEGSQVMSGTSMASPHVAGLVAYIMAEEGLTDLVAITNRIIELGSAQGVARVGNVAPNTVDIMANNGIVATN